MSEQRSITVVRQLAPTEFDIVSYELDPDSARRILLGESQPFFHCSVPDCLIQSWDPYVMFAINPTQTIGNTIIPLCKEHVRQAVREDELLNFSQLVYALALVHQWFTGREQPIVEIPARGFHGEHRPKPEKPPGGTTLLDVLPADVRAKLGVLPPGAEDP